MNIPTKKSFGKIFLVILAIIAWSIIAFFVVTIEETRERNAHFQGVE